MASDVAATHRGWSIVPKRDMGPHGFLIGGEVVKEGLLALDPQGRHVMPGACWFRTVAEAKEHIDIFEDVNGDAAEFWRVSRARADRDAPMRLFEAKRGGDDASFWVALPDDLDRTFEESARMVQAALDKRYGGRFDMNWLREVGDATVAKRRDR